MASTSSPPDARLTPVVILGGSRHGALGIARSLGRLGAPIYAVHPDWMSPASLSRYCRGRILWDIDTAAPEDSLNVLKSLHQRIGCRAILVACSDRGVVFVADHADQLSQWFIFPRQDRHLVRALCSKKEMFFLAKKWNVPTPETTFPASLNDVEQFLATARFPVLLKPIKSGPTSPPIRLVKTKDELLRQYRSWNDPSNLIIQEYIPGPDEMTWTFNGYFDREGKCQLAFTGRKIRNYSPYFGAGSLGVCLHNEEVERLTVEFMASIGYHGPLDLGYRYDVRDGRYKVNDINPRIGAMFRLFVGTNGMDVAQALYQDMMGQPVLPARAPDGRKWIVEDRDWISALVYWRDGKLTFSDWFKSLRGVQEASFFASDDLWPFAGIIADNLRTIWHRMSKRFAGPTNSARLPERQRQRTVS